ncbi:MAG: DUF4837 family protein [Bacteroidales bacterium]|nr:DUF4837 family protein [Candidatus Cryptobacteroides choladohippi]
MKRIVTLLAIVLAAVSCKGTKALLPNVSGKAGEVIVVVEKADWEGSLGDEVRSLLASDCPFLPQKEPLYTLVNVIPTGFTDLFKVHRNIVKIDIAPQAASFGVKYFKDVWASPQCVIQICAADSGSAIEMLRENGRQIISTIEQAERDRIIHNSILYEERSIAPQVSEVFGGSPHFPSGYKLRKKTDDFIWIADEKQYTNQGILIYKYPATGQNDLSVDNIIAHRNEILKDNVPGMFDNTYMTTGTFYAPSVEYIKYNGRDFAQTRGLWEVENDFMGGPFVSHSFYSQDGKDIIVLDAFVYAPRYDKRHYLRQVESIIYSLEWNKDKK